MATSSEDASPIDSRTVLSRAFANRYELDTTAMIELVMRSRSGSERRRIFETASKRFDGRLKSVGRLVEPGHLRGMTILSIEVPGEYEDTFVFLPSLRKVRRVSSAQRGDAFLGSDLTYEDFERRRPEDFEVSSMQVSAFEGEPTFRVEASHAKPQSYHRIAWEIAQSDFAILATRYFKRGAEEPFRTLVAPRSHQVRRGGHVLPTRLRAHNRLRGTRTEVIVSDLAVNPAIPDVLFSAAALESQRPLE